MKLPRFFQRRNTRRKIGLRQGDISFIPITELPEDIEAAGDVLKIEGEGTGHFHELKAVEVFRPKVAVAERPKINWGWLVKVPEAGAVMTHNGAPAEEKHPDLSLTPGLYQVVQVGREYQNPRPVD